MGLTPYFHDDHLTVYQGDCREVMAAMEPESVHCVVTSPPYWGLRDYGTATWVGGDEGCDHRGTAAGSVGSSAKSTLTTGSRDGDWAPGKTIQTVGRGDCVKCGAVRQDSQLGLEPTPEAFVANMVDVFREVRRVLRKDGTLWLNLGDSYAGGGTMGRNDEGRRVSDGAMLDGWKSTPNMGTRPPVSGLKPKDLVGIPWRVAFALQADGWYLRSDIIWAKPNPMPESVTDRPTKAHEYLFLLTKSARYYYDADAVREAGEGYGRSERFRDDKYTEGRAFDNDGDFGATQGGGRASFDGSGRNLRSVWTIATEPYPGAHFATFPRKLVEPCVKAGTSERGVCPECGAPWRRVTETETIGRRDYGSVDAYVDLNNGRAGEVSVRTLSWIRSCAHDTQAVPGVVLDPFGGSGTTGMVAQALGRRAVLIDLNGEYLVQAMARNAQTPLGLVG